MSPRLYLSAPLVTDVHKYKQLDYRTLALFERTNAPALEELYLAPMDGSNKQAFYSVDPMDLPLRERHGMLLGGIGPRPVAWVCSVNAAEQVNLAPFSFFNIFSSNPPILIFSPARSGRTNTTKHTYDNVKEVPEVVVNMVPHHLLHQMVLSSLEYPKGVDEMYKAGLSPVQSIKVKPPRVGESPVQLECKVIEVKELGDEGGAGNLIICQVIQMHYSNAILDENGKPDPRKLDLIGRLGGAWYTKVDEQSLFELKSDVTRIGMGFDAMPDEVKNSPFLTGNQLGILASIPEPPDETSVNDYKLDELSELFMDLQDEPEKLMEALHKRAAKELSTGDVETAWKTLLSFNP